MALPDAAIRSFSPLLRRSSFAEIRKITIKQHEITKAYIPCARAFASRQLHHGHRLDG